MLRRVARFAFTTLERSNRRFSRVGTDPFLSSSQFPWVAEVEASHAAIVAELRRVQQSRPVPPFQLISREQELLTQDDRWKTYLFFGYGASNPENGASCPATLRALDRIPGMKTAMFSILEAGKHLPAHRGPYNGVLRYHLGLVIPEPTDQCGIRVGTETRHWQSGASLVFDDSYDHEAWNDSAEERVVLFVDFVRPLRFPMNVVNAVVIAAVRRSPFITDAFENLREYNREHQPA